jgi:hypothetical protein
MLLRESKKSASQQVVEMSQNLKVINSTACIVRASFQVCEVPAAVYSLPCAFFSNAVVSPPRSVYSLRRRRALLSPGRS